MHTVFVITVCRNAEKLIEETIHSVLGQTYPNVKYLIIDGASTDGTVDIIRKYQDRLTYWISEPDKGIYDAMNKGLEAILQFDDDSADISWVNFMNAGDSFASDDVLSDIFRDGDGLLSKIDLNKIKAIGGDTINFFEDEREEVHHAESANVIPFRLPFSHQSTFVRVKPESFRFGLNYKMAADYNLFYTLFDVYGESAFLILDCPIARYRQEDSLTMNPANQKAIKGEYLKIQSKHRTWRWWKEYLKWRLL